MRAGGQQRKRAGKVLKLLPSPHSPFFFTTREKDPMVSKKLNVSTITITVARTTLWGGYAARAASTSAPVKSNEATVSVSTVHRLAIIDD